MHLYEVRNPVPGLEQAQQYGVAVFDFKLA
jgi:hypothetical protein